MLLKHLISNAGQVLSRHDLMQATTGRDWQYMDRTIDILIARLRKKIEEIPTQPRRIKIVHGAGWRFPPRLTMLEQSSYPVATAWRAEDHYWFLQCTELAGTSNSGGTVTSSWS
ncbi:helix-turn-helix domain-containing protein [Breoghania sp.]|uniref:winged helix-turn-helix domain-containing protein n=1 Tax=Breoghania sp. TaxID=2065378 RepID=UPI0026374185|nr:helix-turn-helix domain-containing protein [Breoghania sp.]MDJ0933322.1 helix-turn-helix domain-containing protein [Breoghania sp.]